MIFSFDFFSLAFLAACSLCINPKKDNEKKKTSGIKIPPFLCKNSRIKHASQMTFRVSTSTHKPFYCNSFGHCRKKVLDVIILFPTCGKNDSNVFGELK